MGTHGTSGAATRLLQPGSSGRLFVATENHLACAATGDLKGQSKRAKTAVNNLIYHSCDDDKLNLTRGFFVGIFAVGVTVGSNSAR
jgi:hypothetical protein